VTQLLVDAATALLKQIPAPLGAVNVLPVEDVNGPRLIVWLSPRLFRSLGKLPPSFQGFPVSVEERPTAVGYELH
jgi:hypothetical protein